ncbi:MAG: phospholipid carrier-dependent glycosyltransferase, partial [Gallionella sp.]
VIVAMWLLNRQRKLLAVILLAFSSLLCVQLAMTGYNTIANERSAKHIATAIKNYVQPETVFYSVLDYEQTLAFYLKHTFVLVQYEDEMDFGIRQEPYKVVPTLGDFPAAWNKQTQALAIMPAQVYPEVQQLGINMQIIYQDSQYIVVKKP